MIHINWKREEEPRLIVNQKGQVVYFTYPMLEATKIVTHGFTTRLGGVSEGMCSTMNLSFTRGDMKEAVFENYHRIAEAIGFDYEDIVCSDQTHTTNVRVITSEDKGNGLTKPKQFFDVDGMITNEKQITLATFYADCVPLYFVDPVHKAIGLSHSGWRGTVGKIGKATVEAMTREYNTNPKDVIAAIGPSICMDCYEVSEDVANEFKMAFSENDDILFNKGEGKYQLDLWKANQYVMLEAGITKEHIEMPNLCTCCNSELLFSHRASKGKRGNLAAFLSLK